MPRYMASYLGDNFQKILDENTLLNDDEDGTSYDRAITALSSEDAEYDEDANIADLLKYDKAISTVPEDFDADAFLAQQDNSADYSEEFAATSDTDNSSDYAEELADDTLSDEDVSAADAYDSEIQSSYTDDLRVMGHLL